MEIKEVREKKIKLAETIKNLLNDFNEETKCIVKDVDLRFSQTYQTFGIEEKVIKVELRTEV